VASTGNFDNIAGDPERAIGERGVKAAKTR
jgi:hypothetical protein